MSGAANIPGDNAGKPPFLAFVADTADIETLKSFAGAHQLPESGIYQGDIRTATEFLKNNPAPVVLLVEIPSAGEAKALLDALADVCDAGTKVITIGTVNEYSFYCWLMEMGIDSYLLKPLTAQMLEGAYQKTTAPAHPAGSQGKPPGKIIAVMAARGGGGATMVALNLAGIIADQSGGKPVALVDVDPQEGSIALTLDIEPSRGLREALERPDHVDSLFFDRVVSKLKNLSVLAAEESLQDHLAVHEGAADTLLAALREKFAVTVLDIPHYPDAFGRHCLRLADQSVLVSELTLVSLRDTLRLSDLMRDVLKMKPPVIIANRIGLAAKQEMPVADFEKGISGKIAHQVSFAPDVFMLVGNDIPAVKNKADAAVKPLYDLAKQLVPEAKIKAAAMEEKKLFDLKSLNPLKKKA